MYFIEIQDRFTAAHSVLMPDDRWEEPHAHDWHLRVFLTREKLNKYHMVADFCRAQTILRSILDPLAGQNLNDVQAIGPSPTAELVARYIFDRFNRLLEQTGVRVQAIALCESENCWAWYTGDSAFLA